MNIRYLQYFVTVAKYLNFTKAAKHLYIAQSGLSQSISTLEKALGFPLFIRDTRSVQLTEAGAVFLKDVKELLWKYEQAVQKAYHINAGYSAHLSIGFLPALGKKYMPQYVSHFQQKYPYIQLELQQFTLAPLNQGLQSGDLDIGFTRSFDLMNNPDIAIKKINTDRTSIVLRKDHPLCKENKVDLSTLTRESFIILSQKAAPGWFNKVIEICSCRGLTPKIIASPPQMDSVFALVAAGMGVSIVPSSDKTHDIPCLHFIDLEGDDTQLDVVVAWNNSNDNSCVPLFISELGEQHRS